MEKKTNKPTIPALFLPRKPLYFTEKSNQDNYFKFFVAKKVHALKK